MPGESFYIEPKYDIRYEKLTSGTEEVGAVITLSNVGLTLDTLTVRSYDLIQSTAEPSKIVCNKTNTYNVMKMAYDKGADCQLKRSSVPRSAVSV